MRSGRSSAAIALIPVLLVLIMVAVPVRAAAPGDPEIESLQKEIDAKGYSWTAKRTWLTGLSEAERRRMIGVTIPPEVEKRFEALQRDFAGGGRPLPMLPAAPSNWDWRDLGGVSAVTC
jgi:hypothetical protein